MRLRRLRQKVSLRPEMLSLFALVAAFSALFFAQTAAAPQKQHIRSNRKIFTIPVTISQSDTVKDSTQDLSDMIKTTNFKPILPSHAGLGSSTNTQLQMLAHYEQVFNGGITDRLMTFTNMPANARQAQTAASEMASKLKEFNHNGISPLVIMEPTTSSGVVNFQNYANGTYDGILSVYFQSLKTNGVTDQAMGMWVYFPEADLPEWGPVDQTNFAPNVIRTVKLQKQYFPASKASILLDAMSYPPGATGWDSGSYTSLAPFVSGIPKGLLDSFGLQGFPWSPPANQSGTANLNPSTFLNYSLAIEAARILGTNNVWLNSGTFGAMYANSKNQTVLMSPSQRQNILNGIANQAINLRNSGFSVAVNIFAEDKSSVGEATDWSYHTAETQAILAGFMAQLQSHQINFWLFDT
jgi:hypothetical protein